MVSPDGHMQCMRMEDSNWKWQYLTRPRLCGVSWTKKHSSSTLINLRSRRSR